MILSFDLDGVIADTDNGVLGLLHEGDREGKAAISVALQQYYGRRQVVLDPRMFVGPNDQYHIVTGRVVSAQAITREWVAHFLSDWAGLHFVGNELSEKLLAAGAMDAASDCLAERKLTVVKAIGATIHFDNNPRIVQRLREEGLVAVQIGGGLC
ncbi:hypothetical protein LCGC14_2665230 [marine sediment metagenome]|uniref:Uncharacterized protein n=1 Tax=marine sediment metagenome TaxID=412755 RepID=A0A0F9CHL8_9ZZZZ